MEKIKKLFYLLIFMYVSVTDKSNVRILSKDDIDDTDIHLFI